MPAEAWEEPILRALDERQNELDRERRRQLIRGQYINWSSLKGRQPPPREFVWHGWIPARCVTLLHGPGGVGKTAFAQQLATMALLNRQLIDGKASASLVLAWFGEDDHDELWRRQLDIYEHLKIDAIDELNSRLAIRPCPDEDITLFYEHAKSGRVTTTECFSDWKEELCDRKPTISILDSATRIAAINESDRLAVTQCLTALRMVCLQANSAVVLLGHDNKQGEQSGSTAWPNTCRSQIHMTFADKESEDRLKISRPKSNYSARDKAGKQLQRLSGVYVWVEDEGFKAAETEQDREKRLELERKTEEILLEGLDKLTQNHSQASASHFARNYLPRLMIEKGYGGWATEDQLGKALDRLIERKVLRPDTPLPWKKGNGQQAHGLARARTEK